MSRPDVTAGRASHAGRGRSPSRVCVPAFACGLSLLFACGGGPPPPPPISVQAIVDSLLPAVERVSALRRTGPVTVGTRTTQQVIEFVTERLDSEFPAELLEGTRVTYALLGLLPPDFNLRQQLLAVYAEQIVGFYDPRTKTLYAVESVQPAALLPVLAHELVHALQDQRVNLDSLISARRGSDRQLAAQAAIEGHATLAMLAWVGEAVNGGPVNPSTIPDVGAAMRAQFDAQPASVLSRAPRIIRDGLIFPYASGAAFMQALWRRPGTIPEAPFGPLMPQSTEQIIQPEESFIANRDEPTELRYDSIPGWTIRYEDTLGAFTTTIFTEENAGVYGASGWDGDRLLLLQNSSGANVILWTSIWDDPDSADRFANTVRGILADPAFGRTGSVERSMLENRPVVRILISDAVDALATVPVTGVHCVSEIGAPAPCAGVVES